MRGKRVKWIKRVVLSKHPIVTTMIKNRYGEDAGNTMTNAQVISYCKKEWTKNPPKSQLWKIRKQKFERGE